MSVAQAPSQALFSAIEPAFAGWLLAFWLPEDSFPTSALKIGMRSKTALKPCQVCDNM